MIIYLRGEKMSNNYEEISRYVDALNCNKKENTLTYDTILTNCIVSSRRLILEIESLENNLIKNKGENYNILLSIGVCLEKMITEIESLSDIYRLK